MDNELPPDEQLGVPAQERSRLLTGGNVSPALVASWERSMRLGFRRGDRALFNSSVSKAVAKRAADENRGLLEHATPEMVKLYQGLGSSRWLALCVDTEGRIICHVGDHLAAPRALQVLMQPGRVLLESELATTAPGCALEERRPAVVSRDEHFLTELSQFFCASAPIFGADGKLVGALDISGVDVRAVPLAGDMISFAVRRIENNLVAAVENSALLRFHCDERLIGTPFEGIIAVDGNGVIVGANRAAGQLLELSGELPMGATLDSVLDGGLEILRRKARGTDRLLSVHSQVGSLTVRFDERERSAARRTRSVSREDPNERGFIADDPRLAGDFHRAVRLASCGLSIIVTGETGTGKEVFARALHRAVRPDGPFLALNCAAIPEGLIESELFGYADGAFTGGRRGGAVGKIEQAHGGTLLLDEIGDMSLPLQGRLLRVLQERTVTKIGESRETPVDLVVICATHRQLEQRIAEGQFREDLYYRLNGMSVHLPPLRERMDISKVIDGLLRRWLDAPAELEQALTPEARACLQSYAWPGNIRQLEQVLRAALALRNPREPIGADDLPTWIRASSATHSSSTQTASTGSLEDAQLQAIRLALADHNGNVSQAARALGVSRGTLYNKLRRSEADGLVPPSRHRR
jgi:sigma-54 dependent transcriptional regulator, acetoin dehydrogenase operon transcriptional activator AcoR